MLLLLLFVSQCTCFVVTIVWRFDVREPTLYEHDWMNELFNVDGFDFEHIYDVDKSAKSSTYVNNSLVAVMVNHKRDGEYFEEMQRRNFRYGILHLSDENINANRHLYVNSHCVFVMRNYWADKFEIDNKVFFFPLGYRVDYWPTDSLLKTGLKTEMRARTVFDRKYSYVFLGTLSSKRLNFKQALEKVKGPSYFYSAKGFFDPAKLSSMEYRKIMCNSVFCPAPEGGNYDTFRLYEALECSCIPLILHTPENYFDHALYGSNPIPIFTDWSAAANFMNQKLKAKAELEKLRLDIGDWYNNHIDMVKQNITNNLQKLINHV